MKKLLTLTIVVSYPLTVVAQEPGYLVNEKPPTVHKPAPPPAIKPVAPIKPKPLTPPSSSSRLEREFARARGLNEYEMLSLRYSRVACTRRLFSPDGLSLEGDGDIKATSISSDFFEVEFPVHIGFNSFGAINPYGNGLEELETVTSRQIVSVKNWGEYKPLKLTKRVRLKHSDGSHQIAAAADEVRVLDSYPVTFLVKETIYTAQPFNLFMFCQ